MSPRAWAASALEHLRTLPVRRLASAGGLVLAATIGAGIGVSLGGNADHRIGPFDASLRVRPSLHGTTVVHLAPLGSIEMDTHDAPVRLDVAADELRIGEARRLAEDPSSIDEVDARIAADARHAIRSLVLRSALFAIAGALAGGLLWHRTTRAGLTAAAIGIVIVLLVGSTTLVTRHPDALAEPKYTGLLTFAPEAVGSVEDVVGRFSAHRAQLSRLVGNVARLYETAQGLESFLPTPETIRVLHVSDIHLNPEAFDVIRQVTRQFDVDAIVDTGDLNDWGTVVESPFAGVIASLGVPYVFVRGNHDSVATEASVAAQPNAVVLDDRMVSVAGLRFWGIGDPRFTPDKSEDQEGKEGQEIVRRFATTVADRVRALPARPDVALVHDPLSASRVPKTVPLVLAGHVHRASERHQKSTLVLAEGSTGGAGLRGLESDTALPLSCSVLYFDPATKRLLAYDRITVSGVATSSVGIERRVLPEPTTTTTAP